MPVETLRSTLMNAYRGKLTDEDVENIIRKVDVDKNQQVSRAQGFMNNSYFRLIRRSSVSIFEDRNSSKTRLDWPAEKTKTTVVKVLIIVSLELSVLLCQV